MTSQIYPPELKDEAMRQGYTAKEVAERLGIEERIRKSIYRTRNEAKADLYD
jgi:hypothetical protein